MDSGESRTEGRQIGGRRGLFWDGVTGRTPMPPAAVTLGFEVLDADPAAGSIRVAFMADESFTNPMGEVLGGFLAAMLFDTVGPALLATLVPDEFQKTLELKTSFLRPTWPGRLIGHGRVVHRDGELAFLDATLADADGLVAMASATARVVGRDGPPRADPVPRADGHGDAHHHKEETWNAQPSIPPHSPLASDSIRPS